MVSFSVEEKIMEKFLQIGDVIDLKEGMAVYAEVPEGFIFSNRRDSMKEKTTAKIVLGEVLDNTLGKTLKTNKFLGKYVVEETTYDGGSTGYDSYPDGWKVKARKLKKDGSYSDKALSISFYQSGCFTAMIEPKDIQTVGKMKRTFK